MTIITRDGKYNWWWQFGCKIECIPDSITNLGCDVNSNQCKRQNQQ